MRKNLIYLCAILACIFLSVSIGSELVTYYQMFATGQQRHELGDDLGFGLLLFICLVPEVIIGVVLGAFVGRYIHLKLANREL